MNARSLPRMTFLLSLLFLLAGSLSAAELKDAIKIPVIHTRTNSYTNVTVVSKGPTDIHIRHDGGVNNILLEDLDATARHQLGLDSDQDAGSEASAETTHTPDLSALRNFDLGQFLKGAGFTAGFVGTVLAAGFLVYLFGCYCWKRICLNAGHEPGFLIWIPFLQMIPMLRAAGMSAWWILALLIPVVSFVVMIVFFFKIVAACGKSFIWAIFLILPLLNIFAFLYLAFSGRGGSTAIASSPPPLGPTD